MCDSNNNENLTEGGIKVCSETEFIRELLVKENIQSYEPEVITLLVDYMNNYVSQIMENALAFMKHSERNNLELKDVQLALHSSQKKENLRKRLSFQELIKLAKEHNKSKLTGNFDFCGLAIPHESLNKTNYKLKSINNYKYGINSDNSPALLDLKNYETRKYNKHQQAILGTTISQKITVKPSFSISNASFFK